MFFSRRKYKKYDDDQLVSFYKNDKDSQAWEELYLRYMPLVYGVSLKILKDKEKSEDVSMYLFQLLPELLLKYHIKEFRSWLFTLTKNHCYTLSKKEVSEKENALNFLLDDDILTEEEVLEKPLKPLNSCLNKLKNEQKICVELFYYEQKSYQEIMEITGFSLKNIKSHIQNGKRNLKICIES